MGNTGRCRRHHRSRDVYTNVYDKDFGFFLELSFLFSCQYIQLMTQNGPSCSDRKPCVNCMQVTMLAQHICSASYGPL